MTVCAFISPPFELGNPRAGVFPLMLADTMATLRQPPPGADAILPATFLSTDITRSSSVRMFRKLQIIGPACVAMAGESDRIATLLRRLKVVLPDLVGGERPMRWLGDEANQMNDDLGRRAVEVVGICPAGSGEKSNYMSYAPAIQLTHLGRCAAAGSGADDVLNFCRINDAQFDGFSGPQPSDSMAVQFALSLNADQIAKEWIGERKNGWGGYVEFAAFIHTQREWLRGGPTLTLLLIGRRVSKSSFRTDLVGRAVAYDPGDADRPGQVLGVSVEPEDVALRRFVLQNILDEGDSTPPPEPNWDVMRNVSACFIFPELGRRVSVALTTAQVAGVTFGIDGRELRMAMSTAVQDELSDQVCRNLGVGYTPTTGSLARRRPRQP
jgi:hypothetical protein